MFAARNNPNLEIITALLKAGTNAQSKSIDGKTDFEFADENEKLKGSNAYWELNNARF
jgi:hypothetical protein